YSTCPPRDGPLPLRAVPKTAKPCFCTLHAHLMSGPRRRPHDLPTSFVIRGESETTTHINRPQRFRVRFTGTVAVRVARTIYGLQQCGPRHCAGLLPPLIRSCTPPASETSSTT